MRRNPLFWAALVFTAAMVLWVTSAHCQDVPVDLPCQPRGEVLLARFHGFPDIPDHDVFFHAGGQESFELADSSIVDPDLISPSAQVEWLVGGGCVGAYTYQYPGVLFPPSSRYARFQLSWGILCADASSCAGWPYQIVFPNDRPIVWHGEVLGVTSASRNLTWKWRGATLTIYEVINRRGYLEINGAHMKLPGQGEVWLSRVVQQCL